MSQAEFLGLLVLSLTSIGGFLISFLKLKSSIEQSIMNQIKSQKERDIKDEENLNSLIGLKISYLEKEIKNYKAITDRDLAAIKESIENIREEILDQHKYIYKALSELLKNRE